MLLHGYLASKECFYWQIKYFSKFYRVTAFDFPGFGKSAPLKDAWSTQDYAEFTADFFRKKGLENVRLIAHSFGGRVALRLLANEPSLIGRALLTGCAGVPPRRGLRYKLKVRTYRMVRKIAPKFAERKFGSKEYRELSPIMRESYKKIVNEDLTPLLKEIKVPVLYVFGENDTATPLYMADILHKGTKDSGLAVMKGTTHFCFCEQPDLFNAIAREFFKTGEIVK